ncbi:MAG: tRNA pseudouridine(55) synthase TruB [Candidatus Saccharimonadales bacterium]
MSPHNVLLIDKPSGWTSFDVVAKIRSQIRAQYQARGEKPTKRQLKVGHSGTLDPFATGLLIILLGDACRQADEFRALDKVYEATVRLGATSTTGDPEGEITESGRAGERESGEAAELESLKVRKLESEANGKAQTPYSNSHIPIARDPLEPISFEIQHVLQGFVGEITQTPPIYSAIKINGERAYKLARAGKAVDMPSRQVTIYSLELLDYAYPELRIRAHVSSGTYIRTLAEDIGRALGTGAYCSALRRTRIGKYDIANAHSPTEIDIDKLL